MGPRVRRLLVAVMVIAAALAANPIYLALLVTGLVLVRFGWFEIR